MYIHTHIMKYYSDKKERNLAMQNMDKPRGCYASEINKTEKEKYRIISFICGVQRNRTNEQNRNKCIDRQQTECCQMRGGWGMYGKGEVD